MKYCLASNGERMTAPGSGTYQIHDGTLYFTYTYGRRLRTAIGIPSRSAAAGVSREEIMDTVKNALALNPPEALRKRLEAKISTP